MARKKSIKENVQRNESKDYAIEATMEYILFFFFLHKKKNKIESRKEIDERIVQKDLRLHAGPIRECKPLSIRLTNLTSSATVTTMFKH